MTEMIPDTDDDDDVTYFYLENTLFGIKCDETEDPPVGWWPNGALNVNVDRRRRLTAPMGLSTEELLRCIGSPCMMCCGDSGDTTIDCPNHGPEGGEP